MGLIDRILVKALSGTILATGAATVSSFATEKERKEYQALIERLSKSDFPITTYISGDSPIDMYDDKRTMIIEQRYAYDREIGFDRKLASIKNYEDLLLFIRQFSNQDKTFLLNNIHNSYLITKDPRKISSAYVDNYIGEYIKLVEETQLFRNCDKVTLIQSLENQNLNIIRDEIIKKLKLTNSNKNLNDFPGANKLGLDGIIWAANTDFDKNLDGIGGFVNISDSNSKGYQGFTQANLTVKTIFRKKVNEIARKKHE